MVRRSTIIFAAALLAAAAPRPLLAAQPPWVEAEAGAMTPLGLRADQVNGATLHGENGDALGEIEAVLASRDGVVAGLAVELDDGVLGIGEHTVLLRFDQVRRVGERIATLLSRAQLEAQPRWDD